MKTINEQIKLLMEEKDLSFTDLSKATGIPRSALQRYSSGTTDKIPFDRIVLIAKALGVTPERLIGWESPPPIKIAETVQIRILGSVAAGYDKPAEEAVEYETVGIPEDWLHGRSSRDFFILQIHGDSMYPHYQDGDYVFCLSTSDMGRSGRIGVVIDKENGEATLKRINYPMLGEVDYGQWMELEPINPNYPKRRISGPDLNNWMVQGRALKVIRTVEEI